MKDVEAYRVDITALTKRIADVKAKATTENRDLTVDEVEYLKKLNTETAQLIDAVATIEEGDRITASLAAPQRALTVQTGKPAKRSDRNVFGSLGEQAVAIINASRPGGQVDPRLFNAAYGLNETTPSEGGFLVQTDFSTELLQDLFATGGLWSKVGTRVPITGNANGTKINGVDETSRVSSTWGGIVVYMVGEAGQITKSKPQFRQIELNLKKIGGLCYATDENLSDSPQLESIIRRGFNQGFGFKLDDLLINGVGGGEPLGFLKAGSLVEVSKETGQKAATIVAENVIKMYSRMFASSLSSAIWLINQQTLPQLLTMSIAVGTGGVPVYLPPGNSLVNAPGGALMGRPVYPIEQCAALGTVGDIMFVDVANGYVVAEKGGLKTDMSIHLRFDYDEAVFRFIMRVDGQPVRATYLTPYKGGATATQSHCIALATRA